MCHIGDTEKPRTLVQSAGVVTGAKGLAGRSSDDVISSHPLPANPSRLYEMTRTGSVVQWCQARNGNFDQGLMGYWRRKLVVSPDQRGRPRKSHQITEASFACCVWNKRRSARSSKTLLPRPGTCDLRISGVLGLWMSQRSLNHANTKI